MKLFFDRKSLGVLSQVGARLSGMRVASVQMRQISCLNTALSQIETMRRIKVDDPSLKKGKEVLDKCRTRIGKVIQPVAVQTEQDESKAAENSALNRGPQ